MANTIANLGDIVNVQMLHGFQETYTYNSAMFMQENERGIIIKTAEEEGGNRVFIPWHRVQLVLILDEADGLD